MRTPLRLAIFLGLIAVLSVACDEAPPADDDDVADDDSAPLPDSDGDGFDDVIDPTPFGFDGAEGREAPLSVQLHLHGSLSEYDATMACHTRQAETYGVDVLWWSDHDSWMQMAMHAGAFDFDEGSLTEEVDVQGKTFSLGFEVVDVTLDPAISELHEGGAGGIGHYWQVGGADAGEDGSWSEARYAYRADNETSHHVTLMADTLARFWLRLDQPIDVDWQLRFTVLLSGDCSGGRNQITYYLGGEDLTGSTSDTHLFAPLAVPPVGAWSEITLPLTDDSAHFAEGDDQSATDFVLQVRARNGAEGTVGLDDLSFEWQREGEQLREYQRAVLDDRLSAGPVVHFVGQEITNVEFGNHLNPIGADQVPLFDYTGTQVISPDAATHYVHEAGGLASCNHPFGTPFGLNHQGEDADLQVEILSQVWLDADAWGCDAVEVGYRERSVDLEHHLMFWDALSDAGHHLTGVGTSDNHWATDWFEVANTFVTWVYQDTPTRGGISAEIEQGRCFFGDPGPFVGHSPLLDLWTEHGAVMGQILVSGLHQVVHVETGYLEGGWSLDLVVDGEVAESVLLTGDETDTVFELARGDMRTIRAVIADADGEIILASNPLYLAEPGEDIPRESRRVVVVPPPIP